MVSVYYADICTCPMPPAREILSDALALWIQLHTHWWLSVCSWYLLSCTSTCTLYWFVFGLAPFRTLVMCDLWWSLSLLDVCTCTMPLAREILSDALGLWIQLHTKYIHTAGNGGLSLLLLCTSILLCTLLDPNENTLALMMVPLCLIYSPVWWPVSVRSWATHLRFEPSCIHIGPLSKLLSMCSFLLVFILMIVLLCLIYAPVWCPVPVISEESAQETKYLHRLSKVHLTRIAKVEFF